ncbi:Holliday junction branch migration protein RuvA [Campylobacter sp. 19-13652]|uniref:Holliday junction branch migration protein RuvA n=1 Tax=Campylobacter sp. 19-13652 TaxID=2840180 RepID=UPI001C789965|nr:Holliday junction branch migration protein RuvA [Campylobacter sp. 19-13652]BCX79471.1 Holliday junction ATP-dependent DNA helicase RuvA [Campylobacter sp. 19-13652]
MIKAIEGKLIKKEPTYAYIKCASGLTYGVHISLFTSAKLETGALLELFITQIIREDANLLYGFLDTEEQRIFELLIKLNGVGASTAMAVCSSLTPQAFMSAIISADDAAIKTVPGIGPKTARRIIAELSDAKLAIDSAPSYQQEALLALESLGFKREKVLKALSECEATDTGELVKQALKKLA